MRRYAGLGLTSWMALSLLTLLGLPAGAQEQKEIRKVVVLGQGGGYLGVRLDEVDTQAVGRLKLPEERGALVRKVEGGGPAEKAGLEVDDVIVRYQGESVESAAQLAREVRETPAGRKVSLEIVRKGATQKLAVVLGQRSGIPEAEPFHLEMPEMGQGMRHFDMPGMPEMPGMGPGRGFQWKMGVPGGPRKLGIEFQPISGQLAKYFKLPADEGILVTSVAEGGPAAKAGVKAGDVLLKLAGKEIEDGSDVHGALANAEPGQEIPLTVLRDGARVELKVVVGGAKQTKEPDEPSKEM